MSEFEQMLNEAFKTIKTGEVVKGTVLAVKENEIVVNIGYKHDGLIQKADFTTEPEAVLTELVNVGDEIEAKVVKINDGDGNVILTTKKARVEKESEVLKEALENGTVLTATVDEAVKGGLSLTVDEVKVFIPASLVSTRFEPDQSGYVGKEIRFQITEYNPKKHRVIGNRKAVLEAEYNQVIESLEVGSVIEGKVARIADFGAFIDLGGVDGLLHVSEMSWGHVSSPKKMFKVGDTVKCYILKIEDKKIALSCKFPNENPWREEAIATYAEGNVVKGKVARLTDFGAFVEIAPYVDGLIHISQISYDHIEKPSDVLTLGQEIEAEIVKLDVENKRISLSMKKLLPAPEKPEKAEKPEKTERRPRGNRAPKEEVSMTNEDGTFNIEKFIEQSNKEEDRKEQKAKEEAEALKEAAEAVTEEVKAEAEEAKTEE